MIRGEQTVLSQAGLAPRFLSAVILFFRGIKIRRRERTLHLCDSLALGEKRFVTVVQCGEQRYLLGVTSQSISLLQQLGPASEAVEMHDTGRASGNACE
jgi:flagellar biogenesis protein FliO